ncbi:hypothetical protein RDWZM_007368 [Blomia tropicalis]|uniref:Protein tweety homolog n=1 Tax=Blomia tropicalis TaxID=40697 RepID=A0A9Q0LZP9_BLOTA|nr:hypothetical protein RDWZM_007368 [Blomia tropicalis]
MPFSHEGYNISYNAAFFNAIPHLHLTSDGIVPLSNKTFDYERLPYLNSLLVTFIIPLIVLLIIITIYLIYFIIVRAIGNDEKELPDREMATYNSAANKVMLHHLDQNDNDQWSSNSNNTIVRQQQRLEMKLSVKKKVQQRCHGLYLIFGLTSITIACYGTFLLNQGLNRTDSVLTEFIRVSTNSKQTIGNLSQTLTATPSPLQSENYYEEYSEYNQQSLQMEEREQMKSPLQKWFPSTYSYIKSYANYKNSSSENIRHFQTRFENSNYAITTMNIVGCLLTIIFWILFIGICIQRINLKFFIMFNFTIIICITIIFNLNFTGNIALSDFCLNAKPIITDISVYRIPSNNLTENVVNYYLYCELNRLNLDSTKKAVMGYLDRLDSFPIFNGSQMFSGIVSGFKNGIEQTYDSLHCMELNRLINDGLTEFCTTPIDAMAITSFSYLFTIFLFIVILFMVTFSL